MRDRVDVLGWVLIWVAAMVVVITSAAVIIAARSDEPICPEGEAYVFSHNLVVGRVIIPQYVCREVGW